MWQVIRVVLTVACVVAAAAVGWLWKGSYSAAADVHYLWRTGRPLVYRSVDAGSIDGGLFLSVLTLKDDAPGRAAGWHWEETHSIWSWALATEQDYYLHGWMWRKFGVVNGSGIKSAEGMEAVTGVAVPHWCVVLALLGFPVSGVARWGRRKWRGRGEVMARCAACGYDLRASAGRCPECGKMSV
jgi:hypothetical protein